MRDILLWSYKHYLCFFRNFKCINFKIYFLKKIKMIWLQSPKANISPKKDYDHRFKFDRDTFFCIFLVIYSIWYVETFHSLKLDLLTLFIFKSKHLKKKYYKAAAIGMIYRNITNKSINKWSVFLGVIVKKRIYAFLCMRIFRCKLCLHLVGLSTRDVRCVL